MKKMIFDYKLRSFIIQKPVVKKYLISFLMVSVCIFIYGCDAEQAHINKGHRWFKRGNLDSAIMNYTWALKDNSSNPDTYFFRGFAYTKKGDLDSALADFSSAIDLDPKYAKAYINRGTIWKEKGLVEKALQDYSRVVELNPDDYRAYMVRADLWFQSGCFNNAISDYNVAIKNNFDNAVAYMGSADAFYQKQDYGNATKDYQKAIEIKPDYSFAYNNLAWLLSTCVEESCRDGKKALEFAKKAVELDPSQNNLHTNAVAYAENGMFKHALSLMEEILKIEQRDDFKKHLSLFKNNEPLRELPRAINTGSAQGVNCN